MIVLWVAVGAAVGAPARYLADRAIQARHQSVFPFGTLTVNLVASFVLGIMTGVGSSASVAVAALIGTGFCGSLSTYSTFSFETMRLADGTTGIGTTGTGTPGIGTAGIGTANGGSRRTALNYVLVSVVAGCGLAALGWWLAA